MFHKLTHTHRQQNHDMLYFFYILLFAMCVFCRHFWIGTRKMQNKYTWAKKGYTKQAECIESNRMENNWNAHDYDTTCDSFVVKIYINILILVFWFYSVFFTDRLDWRWCWYIGILVYWYSNSHMCSVVYIHKHK